MILKTAERIQYLREKHGMTQAALAKKLGISRNSVNLWEMSLTNPSVANVVEMTKIFHVSADYILGLSDDVYLDISNLTSEERDVVFRLVECLNKKQEEQS